MGRGSGRGHVRCVPDGHGQDTRKRGREQPAHTWYIGSGWCLKWSFVLGALVAFFVSLTNAWAVECLPSAETVRQQHPEGWPSWTLRARGHEGAKCWYAATRSTAHQHPKETAAPETVPEPPRAFTSRNGLREQYPASRTPSPLLPSFEAASLPLTTGTTTEATSEDNERSRAIARVAANVESSVKVDEANYLAELPRDGLPAPFSIASGPVPATDRAFTIPRLVAVFGSALVFASL